MDTNIENKKKLRTGFTTGSCATASSKAGVLSIINQKKIEKIDIILPKRTRLDIQINSCEFTEKSAKCSVIKDGGDDPDVTHGAEIFVDVVLTDKIGEIEIDGEMYHVEYIAGSGPSEITDDDGTIVKVITGKFWGLTGPVDGIASDPLYLDVIVPPFLKKSLKIDTYRNTFAYIFEGSAKFLNASLPKGILLEKEVLGKELNIRDMSGNRTLVQFGTGEEIIVQAGEKGVRFLLVVGTPIKEPVAWHGPIVMNTREELQQAFQDLQNDKFIKPTN